MGGSRGRVCAACLLAGLAAGAAGLSPGGLHMEGELQLFGGNTDSGRLGMYHAGEWGAVCSGSWGLSEATVACRMLGFERSFQAMAMPAPASTPVWLSSVSCAGNESSLLDCAAKRWRPGNCSAADSVGVSCLAPGIGGPYAPDVDAMINTSLSQLRDQPAADAPLLPPPVASDDTCDIQDGVPLPFADAGSSYVFGDQLAPFFAEQDDTLRRYLCDPDNGDALQSELLQWTQQGLVVNSFGIDASTLLGDGAVPHWAPGVPTRALEAATDEQQGGIDAMMQSLRRMYLSGDGLDSLHWQIDRRGRARSAAGLTTKGTEAATDRRIRRLVDTLHHEGFVSLSAADLNLDLRQLQDEAHGLLAAGANRSMVSVTNLGAVRSARGHISSLEPMLRSDLISGIVRGYLGNNTMLHGYKVNELNRPAAKKGDGTSSYISSLWHHDRAGRRLKLFVFLHDVDCEFGRPTQVALGSHRLLYYNTATFPSSRFNDDAVRSQFRIKTACGKAGTGYLFDTHSLHRGMPQGPNDHSRTAVIAEYRLRPVVYPLSNGLPRGFLGGECADALCCRGAGTTRSPSVRLCVSWVCRSPARPVTSTSCKSLCSYAGGDTLYSCTLVS